MNWLLRIMKTNSTRRKPSGVNLLNTKLKSEQNVRSMFESTSLVIPRQRNLSHRSFNSDILRNSSTQTSKTMISLGLERSPRMSPDSLSPKTDYQAELNRDTHFNLDKPTVVNDAINFCRKGCILRYLHKPTSENDDMKKHTLPENSLTKVFLDKAKRKTQESHSPKVTRSNFLQQTSPLRNIIPMTQDQNFKSHSYATFSEKVQTVQPGNLLNTRFKVKDIREKPPASDIVKPVKYFCEKELTLNLRSSRQSPKSLKNHSFMSPTFSSEQKNKMREINTVTKLISPTRRGRSASPKNNVEESPSIVKKVPYIDKSSSSIFHSMGDTVYELNLNSPRLGLSNSTILETCPDINPEHELVQAIAKMRNVDWNTALRGLAEIIELCRSVDTNIIYPHMTIINQRIIDLLKSPRSHVCRTTCKATGHLFEYIKDTRRPEFDEIVDTLLCRTADSNKFIRHDANLALDCMVTHIPTLHAIRSICAKGPEHKNALVRIATARLVVCAVVIAGSNSILNPNNSDYTRRRVMLNMVKFLNDKSMDVRKYGERLYKLLCGERMFELYLRTYIEKETIQKIKLCFKHQHKNGVR